VLLEESARTDQQVLEQLRVPSPRGTSVPLAALADIKFGESPVSINRYDRQVQAIVEADLAGGAALSEASSAVWALPMMQNLPPGTTVLEGGQSEHQAELTEEFGRAMRNGLTIVYILLGALFGSLLQPLTVLFSLPLSVVGAIMALLLANLAITTPVLIGILMLMGIVSKNAIMLIDFAVEARHRGVKRNAAIVDACHKRARPIVMTTIAMVGGMAPVALGLGLGGEFRSPMAVAVIGGLLVSTLLSLLFVPALFTLMDDLGDLCWGLFGRLIGKEHEASRTARLPFATHRKGDDVMDIAGLWRSFRPNPADAPRAGAHFAPVGAGITTSISQECVVALPRSSYSPNLVTVTVTSLRPGAAGHVRVAANLNTPNGSYQGPTTTVGDGDFTATNSQVIVRFVVLPWAGFPVLGFGGVADWTDGTPQSLTLDYVLLECNPWVWWGWPARILNALTSPFSRSSSTSPGSGTG
jgi:hypothetical protein